MLKKSIVIKGIILLLAVGLLAGVGWAGVKKLKKIKAGSEITTVVSTEKIYAPQLEEQNPNIILVKGNPPLKQEIINLYFRFFEFLTKTNLTEAEKKQLKEYLIAEFKRGNKAEKDDLLRFEERWQKINALPSEQKEVVRVQLVKGITAEAQKNPDNMEGKLLLEIMGKVNKVLVPGEPPLTQQTVDAYLEMVAFLVSIERGEEFYITQEMKQNATKRLIKLFEKFPIEEKRKMAELDINWTTFRMVWQEASDLQKIQFKQSLKQAFSEEGTEYDEMRTIPMENISSSKKGAPEEKFKMQIYMPGLYDLGNMYTPPGLFR